MKEVMIVTGAGQISMAIARRVGFGKKIILGDKNMDNCKNIAKITFCAVTSDLISSWCC